MLRAPVLVLALASAAAAAPVQPPFFRPIDSVTRNITHMSPLLSYTGDVDYVFAPPGTPDGTMTDDISFSHHILKEGASAEFNFSGSAFVINGWAGDAMLRVREYPLDSEAWVTAPEAGRAEWWKFGEYDVHVTDAVSERTLVAVLGDADDGPRRVRLDVTSGEVWLSRVITQTDVP